MSFQEWFDSTWELMQLSGTGKIQMNWDEFQEYLKEAFEAGKENE